MAAALPVALIVGLIGDVSVAAVRRIGGRRGGARVGLRRRLRALTSPGSRRPTPEEAGGSLAAMLGAGLATGAALGLGPGSAALVYLGLAVSAVGTHIAAASSADGVRPAGERLGAALFEPVFVVALGTMFLRWGSSDLEAVRGTQTVLGPGVALGPAGTAVGLTLAGIVVAVSGALRLASPPYEPSASALLTRLGTWSAAGATALGVAVLVAGSDLGAADIQDAAIFAAAAVLAALVLATAGVVMRGRSLRWRVWLAAALLVAAGASLFLVAR